MIREEYLIWCFHSQAFSWTVIEFFHHRLDLLIGDMVELSFFGKYCLMSPLVFSLSLLSHEA
jgi:hypothetical protein